MSLIVVADTSPLRYLAEIGYLELLPQLFGKVYVPAAVHGELQKPSTPAKVYSAFQPVPEWLVVVAEPALNTEVPKDLAGIDVGERHAILLAQSLSATELLIDDRKGAVAAQACGLYTTGTLGILLVAARKGMIDLSSTFDLLRKTNFYCPERLMQRLLKDVEVG